MKRPAEISTDRCWHEGGDADGAGVQRQLQLGRQQWLSIGSQWSIETTTYMYYDYGEPPCVAIALQLPGQFGTSNGCVEHA